MYVLKEYHLDITTTISARDLHTTQARTTVISEDVDEADPNLPRMHAILTDTNAPGKGDEAVLVGQDVYVKSPGQSWTLEPSDGSPVLDGMIDLDSIVRALNGTGSPSWDVRSAVYEGTDKTGHRFELYWDSGGPQQSASSGPDGSARPTQFPMNIWTDDAFRIVKLTYSGPDREQTMVVSRPNQPVTITLPTPAG